MKSKIKFFFENSQYYENYKNIDHIVLQFNKIKNEYKISKKKYKKDLFYLYTNLSNMMLKMNS
jgi:hypothetical protein